MKWIKTPHSSLVHSHCKGNDGASLGWIAYVDGYIEAWVCNGYETAGYLGHHKTPRLAQLAVERELLRRWFNFGWIVFDNNTYSLCVNTAFYNAVSLKEKPAILARAKREFLEQL